MKLARLHCDRSIEQHEGSRHLHRGCSVLFLLSLIEIRMVVCPFGVRMTDAQEDIFRETME